MSFGRRACPADETLAWAIGIEPGRRRLLPSSDRERELGRPVSSIPRFSPVLDRVGVGVGAGELDRELADLVSDGRARDALIATMIGFLWFENRRTGNVG